MVAYVIWRPAIEASVPHLLIAEFPAALVIGALALLALKPDPPTTRSAEGDEEPSLGRRHAQVIRDLADPEAERVRAPVAEWLENGANREQAVDALASAFAPKRDDTAILAAQIDAALPVRERNRARRERALRKLLSELRPTNNTGV